ncbi:MAG: hypothetical protein FWG64_00360 [Firmicutes bacterium]|nr:hypothetical protein [Bacillota bacterium]
MNEKIAITADNFTAVNSQMDVITLQNTPVLRVVKDSKITLDDEPTFAKLNNFDFHNGTISAKVMSRLLPNAPDHARGFIGICFRITPQNDKFEGLYIRPTNARAEDQLRRNRSTQYFSYPNYKWDTLRNNFTAKYESYVDLELDTWIDFAIKIQDEQAKLYINSQPQPVLIVNDLKHGVSLNGSISLWVDIGTEGFFKDLEITK